MPPYLRLGHVVGKRSVVVHEPLIICTCSECAIHEYFDLEAHGFVHGQKLTKTLFNEHRKRDRQRLNAAKHFSGQAASSAIARVQSGLGYQECNSPEAVQTECDLTEEGNEKRRSGISNSNKAVDSEDDERNNTDEKVNVDEHCDNIASTFPTRARKSRKIRKTFIPDTISNKRRLLDTQLRELSAQLTLITAESFRDSFNRQNLVFIDDTHPNYGFDNVPSVLPELDKTLPVNQAFIQHEEFIRRSMAFLKHQRENPMGRLISLRVSKLFKIVQDEQKRTTALKRDCWLRQKLISGMSKEKIVYTSIYSSSLRRMNPVPCLIYVMAATLYFLADLSFNDIGYFLSTVVLLVKLSIRGSTRADMANVVPSIPSDFRTIVKSLRIDPIYKSLICCPSCFSTYSFDENDSSTIPELCVYQSTTLGKPCGRRLRKKVKSEGKKTAIKPVREFCYQDLRHWIGRMYSRPDIETYLDQAKIPKVQTGKMDDIWDGSVLRDFLGPDGQHFMDRPAQEGRLVFGLNMDGFNPYGNKEAGKNVSICGIYVVCFNLPPDVRYKPENVFLLGIVPGPREPSTHKVNHLIRPLVDELLLLWTEGIFLTSTPKYPQGRHVRGALIPVICDLPAARRVAGLGSHASGHFCSECLLNLRDINELDQSKWTARQWEEHLRHASTWLDAETEYQREKIFQEHGIRWSQLLRLPYWDPTKFVVIDSMHGFYLRMFHRHIRKIWGIDHKLVDNEGESLLGLGLDEEEMDTALHVFQHGRAKDQSVAYPLERLSKEQLQFLCREYGLHYGGRKSLLIKHLTEHKLAHGFSYETPSTSINDDQQASNSNQLPKPSESGTTVMPNLGRAQGLTSRGVADLSTRQQRQPLSTTEIATLYRLTKTDLLKEKKERLMDLCAAKLGGKASDYKKLKKPFLIDMLHDMRVKDGIIHENGRIIKPKGNKTEDALGEITDEGLQNLVGIYETGSKSRVSSLKKHFLAVLCAMKIQSSRTYNDYENMKKDELEELLNDARFADGILDENGNLIDEEQANSKRKDQAVLGRDTLQAIRDDMDKIKLPSWFNRAPKHPGEVKWGKFKADEWKAFCTVNLPITLTRLWGSLPEQSRKYQMLQNFLHMVTAVKIANKRSINGDDIKLYENHMISYMSGFLQLYPFANITPYQHLSLHFPSQLRRFGPTHSWRCFAFERFNGIIQGLPTNNKFGEMEKSMFVRFCRMQNLRSLYTEAALPEELCSVVKIYEKRYHAKVQGTLSEDIAIQFRMKGKSTNTEISIGLINTLNGWLARNSVESPRATRLNTAEVAYVTRYGHKFEAGAHPNGYIIFRRSGESKPGRIVNIISYMDPSQNQPLFFALVRQYTDLSEADVNHDYFRRLPQASGYISYGELGPEPMLVPLTDIITHFASIGVDIPSIRTTGPCLLVLPLHI